MELKEFIVKVLDQMADLRNSQNKSNYLVDELEFELAVNQTETGNVGVNLLGFGGNAEVENQNSQKVRVKLIPKNSKRNISMTI